MSTEEGRVTGPELLTLIPDGIHLPDYQLRFRELLKNNDKILYTDQRVTASEVMGEESYTVFHSLTGLPNYMGIYGEDPLGRIGLEEVTVWTYSTLPNPVPNPVIGSRAIVAVEEVLVQKQDDDDWSLSRTVGALPINTPKEFGKLHASDYLDLIEGNFDRINEVTKPMDTKGLGLLVSANQQLSRIPGKGHLRSAMLPKL